MTKKELELALQEVLQRLQAIEQETATKKEEKKGPVLLLRFAFNNWNLRQLMKTRRVKWNPDGKGWEISGKVTRDELGSNDYELVEF